MIIVERKSLEALEEMTKDCGRLLVLGCETCSAMCLAGGRRQVAELASAIRMARKMSQNEDEVIEDAIARQCESEFIDHVKDKVAGCDAVLSLACGAGVQTMAQTFPDVRILPAVNTKFIGSETERGVWKEMCMACGDCVLSRTGGVCPVTRCAKGLLNGACGGASEGKCEVGKERPCAWQEIYHALKRLNMLHYLKEKPQVKDWPVHPGKVVREDLREGEAT
ncbi:MAG: methylenetetrahydrofolate reductase C-terminal domain-containing protein [Deltaproteobacteria bacterium]|nr:methylenetetrahydrofolate reductase C-terminal domain-containing protein [Deltaproteobacteria bacterium]